MGAKLSESSGERGSGHRDIELHGAIDMKHPESNTGSQQPGQSRQQPWRISLERAKRRIEAVSIAAANQVSPDADYAEMKRKSHPVGGGRPAFN